MKNTVEYQASEISRILDSGIEILPNSPIHNALKKALNMSEVSRSNNIKNALRFIIKDEEYMFEDDLPTMSDKEYSEWFENSIVYNGVRVGRVVITR